jgi:adenylyltransferase/sulfurtransferase
VRVNEYALRFSTGGHELTVFGDGRAIVKGTSDLGVARSLYARYVG